MKACSKVFNLLGINKMSQRQMVTFALFKIIAILLVTLGCTTWLMMFIPSHSNKTLNVPYYSEQASLNGLNSLLIDSRHMIYALTDNSCFVAFDMSGKCVYSVYLPWNGRRANQMCLLEGAKIAVDIGGTPYFFTFQEGVLIDVLSYEKA